jgi:hypothetical protein
VKSQTTYRPKREMPQTYPWTTHYRKKESEGANISGNKELRKEGKDEDEDSSMRAKVPLPTETTE